MDKGNKVIQNIASGIWCQNRNKFIYLNKSSLWWDSDMGNMLIKKLLFIQHHRKDWGALILADERFVKDSPRYCKGEKLGNCTETIKAWQICSTFFAINYLAFSHPLSTWGFCYPHSLKTGGTHNNKYQSENKQF